MFYYSLTIVLGYWVKVFTPSAFMATPKQEPAEGSRSYSVASEGKQFTAELFVAVYILFSLI